MVYQARAEKVGHNQSKDCIIFVAQVGNYIHGDYVFVGQNKVGHLAQQNYRQ